MDFKTHLETLIQGILHLDEDPKLSLHFYYNPDKKREMFYNLLHHAIEHVDRTQDLGHHAALIQRITKWMDHRYDLYMWPCHEVHFHVTFDQYLACPFTCLDEIATCIQKAIEKENIH